MDFMVEQRNSVEGEIVGLRMSGFSGPRPWKVGGEPGGETGSEDNRKEISKTQGLESYNFMDVPSLRGESCPEDNFLLSCLLSFVQVYEITRGNIHFSPALRRASTILSLTD